MGFESIFFISIEPFLYSNLICDYYSDNVNTKIDHYISSYATLWVMRHNKQHNVMITETLNGQRDMIHWTCENYHHVSC